MGAPPAPQKKRSRGLVIGVVVGVLVIVVIVAVVVTSGGKKSGIANRPVTTADYTLNVLFCGVDKDGFATMQGFLTNTSSDNLDFKFDVAFVDSKGHTVGHGLGENSLNVHEHAPISAGVKVDAPPFTSVTCTVTFA